MKKLLTIAIPTFNRAELLDKQLTWLAKATTGWESDCEIYVSDNCSTDKTQEVIQKWQATVSNLTFKSHKHTENIGVLKNIAHCLTAATTKYVWTIGDDDPIQDRAVTYVLTKLKQHEDLSLIFLNFSGHNKVTGKPDHPPTIVGNRWFDIQSEDGTGDGKALFEHCFAKSVGAVIFLTATIYRTDLIHQGLQIWPEAPNNWIYLAYLAGYCAQYGKVIVTGDNYLECVVGVSYWQKDQKSALLMQYQHIPEVLLKLEAVGYSQNFCRRMIVKNFRDVNLKVFLGALRRWPGYAITTGVSFLTLVIMSALTLIRFPASVPASRPTTQET